MKFGKQTPAAAIGSIVAHSIRTISGRIRKGQSVSPELVEQLQQAGVKQLVCATLESGDVHEDEAALAVAHALAGTDVSASAVGTGRANLHARVDGLLNLSRAAIDAANAIDEGITLATLLPDTPVSAGRMIATIKIIPFAVPAKALAAALTVLDSETISISKRGEYSASLVHTRLPGQSEKSVIALQTKMRGITEQRLLSRGAHLIDEQFSEHAVPSLANALTSAASAQPDWILIIGASAISDRRDVIPEAIESLGGVIEQFGMPMDPGNLVLVARLQRTIILGLPGCARSPATNGLDRILDRLSCNLPVDSRWLRAQGVGGLLGEIVDRPRPRVIASARREVAGLLLAAGESRRAGSINKLLHPYADRPMVAHAARLLELSSLKRLVVITGHEGALVESALSLEPGESSRWSVHHNSAFGSGMASSLVLGISSLIDCDGVIVCLGDMPHVEAVVFDALLEAFAADPEKALFIPVHEGQRGNPVLIAKRLFDSVLMLEGDIGARVLAQRFPDSVVEITVDCPGVLADYDTPETLSRL